MLDSLQKSAQHHPPLSTQELLEIEQQIDAKHVKSDMTQLLLCSWEKQLHKALQAEKNPLLLLPLLENYYATSIQFAALIRYLMLRDISVNDIIQSGLLQRFCACNAHQIDHVELVLHLLREKQDLIRMVELIQVTDLLKLQSNPASSMNFSFTPIFENWQNLLEHLGDAFLLQILGSDSSFSFPRDWFKESIQSKTTEELQRFYKTITTSVAAETRNVLFERLSQYVSFDQALNLLHEKKVSIWIMLSFKPELLDHISKQTLTDWIDMSSITFYEIDLAIRILNRPQLLPFDRQIHLKLLQCLIEQSHLNLSPKTNLHFITNKNLVIEFNEVYQIVWARFKEDITRSIPLTSDSYKQLLNDYRLRKEQWRLLERLSKSKLHYPESTHELNAHVLSEVGNNSQFDINVCLNLFYPRSGYQSERVRQSDIYQTLSESLTFKCNLNEVKPAVAALVNMIQKYTLLEIKRFENLDGQQKQVIFTELCRLKQRVDVCITTSFNGKSKNLVALECIATGEKMLKAHGKLNLARCLIGLGAIMLLASAVTSGLRFSQILFPLVMMEINLHLDLISLALSGTGVVLASFGFYQALLGKQQSSEALHEFKQFK